MRTRRVSGKICNEHVASLGSVDTEVSVRERVAFWAKLPERLARLGNRVGPDDHAKIYDALHARIPMVTPDEQRAIQEENAKDDERFWDAMRGLNASHIEGYKAHIALAETKIAEVAKAAEKVETARNRLEKLRRGEDVSGGLGKRLDISAMLKAAGITRRLQRKAMLFSSLTKAEFETLLERTTHKGIEAGERITEGEARRILRARK
jgi:hypothetical protein